MDEASDCILEYFIEGCFCQIEKKQEKAHLPLCLQEVLYLLGLYILNTFYNRPGTNVMKSLSVHVLKRLYSATSQQQETDSSVSGDKNSHCETTEN